MKKCIYCKIELDESSVIDVCERCGLQVWGKNMFNAIVQNMESARDDGNLYQGSVSTTPKQDTRRQSQASHQSSWQSQQNNQAPQKTSPAPQKTSFSSNPFSPTSSLVLDAIKSQQELLEESKRQS